MLVCKIELRPDGDADRAYSVGEVRISPSGGDCFITDYAVEIDKASRQARTPGLWRCGTVRAFDHSQLGTYDLLLHALIACLGGRSHALVRSISAAGCIFQDPETQTAAA